MKFFKELISKVKEICKKKIYTVHIKNKHRIGVYCFCKLVIFHVSIWFCTGQCYCHRPKDLYIRLLTNLESLLISSSLAKKMENRSSCLLKDVQTYMINT